MKRLIGNLALIEDLVADHYRREPQGAADNDSHRDQARLLDVKVVDTVKGVGDGCKEAEQDAEVNGNVRVRRKM